MGESILVRLTLRAQRPLSHLILEDPRVTGFEVDALLPEGAERPWSAHAEERDDRAVFFLDGVEEGETVLEYLARAATDSGTGSQAQVRGGVLGKTGTAKLVKHGKVELPKK